MSQFFMFPHFLLLKFPSFFPIRAVGTGAPPAERWWNFPAARPRGSPGPPGSPGGRSMVEFHGNVIGMMVYITVYHWDIYIYMYVYVNIYIYYIYACVYICIYIYM